MAPEEWPIAAPAADRAVEPARPAGRSRLDIVRSDFFLDPEKRLTEQERALMTALLDSLVAQLADDLRAELPLGLAAANDGDGSRLLGDLRSSGLLDLPQLVDLLLRRADEERIAVAVRAHGDVRPNRHLQSLVAGDSPDVSAAAMALILARGRRRDRLGQPLVELDDLATPTARSLAYAIAAGLSRGNPWSQAPLADAVEAVLARHDPRRSVATLIASLATAMEHSGMLDDIRLGAAAEAGDVGLLAEGLARRAAVPTADALDHLLVGGNGRLVLLLRMAAASRELAARILAALGELVGIGNPGREIATFESLSDDEVSAARQRFGHATEYRDALSALEAVNGKRSA